MLLPAKELGTTFSPLTVIIKSNGFLFPPWTFITSNRTFKSRSRKSEFTFALLLLLLSLILLFIVVIVVVRLLLVRLLLVRLLLVRLLLVRLLLVRLLLVRLLLVRLLLVRLLLVRLSIVFSDSLEDFAGSISSNVITHSMLLSEPIIPLHPAEKVALYPDKLFILT